MPTPTVYVSCDCHNHYEGLTKEQIIAAIAEATGNTPTSVDDAFITKIKEMNANAQLKFWIGTTAQFNALATKDGNTLYIMTDDDSADEWDEIADALNGIVDGTTRVPKASHALAADSATTAAACTGNAATASRCTGNAATATTAAACTGNSATASRAATTPITNNAWATFTGVPVAGQGLFTATVNFSGIIELEDNTTYMVRFRQQMSALPKVSTEPASTAIVTISERAVQNGAVYDGMATLALVTAGSVQIGQVILNASDGTATIKADSEIILSSGMDLLLDIKVLA